MKKVIWALGLFVLAGMLPAQENGARPAPKILQIYREFVKPGHLAAHEKVEAGWPKAIRANKNPGRYLGMTSLTGPNEAWFVSGYDSYDAWEKQLQSEEANPALIAEFSRLATADGEHLENMRVITARYREDISHRPPLNIGDYRYMQVVTVRVRPGTGAKFTELRKAIKAAHEKAGLKDWYSVFEVQSGMVAPTFLIFIPMKSLKDVDEAQSLHTSAAYVEALGGEEGQKKNAELSAAAVLSNEGAIFKFNPKMSTAPENYLVGNADFWAPKPMMMKSKGPQVAEKKP